MARLLDIMTAIMLLIVLSPVMLVFALIIALTMGRPVIFRQKRPGRNGLIFNLYKFRTMTDKRGPDGHLLPDEQRLTQIGKFIRATSIDELPQFWNIIKGNMSLVGPRPLLAEYLELYTPRQARRHEVRPGITGWAQVNGRNAISWEEKFEMDVWYVDHKSLLLDIRILAMTCVKVLRRKGISAENEATMSKFTGSSLQTAAECEEL